MISNIKSQEDSVKTYKLDEITVKSGIVIESKAITKIDSRKLRKADAVVLSDLAKFVPSMKVQTNSRGETLFYLRGSGERQLSLIFDGVPLNIPWDNRIDLSLVPTNAIDELSITKGIPSVVYGANTLAGVINMTSKSYSGTSQGKFKTMFSENAFRNLSGYWLDGNEKLSYLASFNYKESDGYDLPESFNNEENPGDLRINSFNKSLSGYGKIGYKFSNVSDISFSLSYIDSEKGVPPETDVVKTRYWQYPVWNKLTAIVNGSFMFEDELSSLVAYSFAFTKFDMEINQFNSIAYEKVSENQEDEDIYFNSRIIYTKFFDSNSLIKLAFNGYTITHNEKITEYNNTNIFKSKYSQNVFSVGAEYEYSSDRFTVIAGLGMDGVHTPKFGNNPDKDTDFDYSINTAFIYSINDKLTSQLNFGRKTRFPSMRESYSTALGKFVINPDLKPEVAYTTELGLTSYNLNAKTEFNIFLTYISNGLTRRTLPEKQYMRINEDKIRSYGLEFISDFNITNNLYMNLNLTYLNAKAKDSEGEYSDTLEYKPEFVAGLNLQYNLNDKFLAVAELNYLGKEFGQQEGFIGFRRLPDYFLMNLRLSYNFDIYNDNKLEVFLRGNNIFDKLYYTQWSLPESGRRLFFGVSIDF